MLRYCLLIIFFWICQKGVTCPLDWQHLDIEKVESYFTCLGVQPDMAEVINTAYESYSYYGWTEKVELSNLFFEKTLELVKRVKFSNDTLIGRCFVLWGLNRQYENDFPAAISKFKTGLQHYQKVFPQNDYKVYSVYANIGEAYYLSSNVDSALSYLFQSIENQKSAEMSRKWPRTWGYIGDTYALQGNSFLANAANELAEYTYADLYSGNLAEFYGNWSLGLRRLNLLHDAIEKAHQSLRIILKQNGDPYTYANSLGYLGQAFTMKGDLDSALYYYTQELDSREKNSEINPVSDLGVIYNNMGTTLNRMGRFEEASYYLKLSIEKYRSAGDVYQDIRPHVNQIINYILRQDFISAYQKTIELEKTVDITDLDSYSSHDHLDWLHEQLRSRYRYYVNSKNGQVLQEAYQLIDTILNQLLGIRAELIDQQSKLYYVEHSRDIYDQAIQISKALYQIKNDPEILKKTLELIENGKSASLNDYYLVNHFQVQDSLSSWNIDHQINEIIDNSTLADSLASLLIQRYHLPDRADEINQFYQSNPYIADIRKNQVLWHFFAHRDSSYTFIEQDKNHLFLKELNTPDLIFQVIKDISNPNSKWLEHTEALSAHLQSEFDLTGKELLVIPDGMLYFFPFSILQQGGNSLLDICSISYGFSKPHLSLVKHSSSNHRNLIGFAPEFNGKDGIAARSRDVILEALKYNQEEIANIQKHFPKAKMFTGTTASKAHFLSVAGQASILHLASHAISSQSDSIEPRVYFYSRDSDSYLTAEEIYPLKIPADMVVLSACNTNIGEYAAGEGVLSLGRSFAYAGTRSIVASLWPVNDQSTAMVMEGFYKYLKHGNTKDESLRKAKLTYLDAVDPRYQHPFYWASFVAYGNMESIAYGPNKLLLYLLGAGLILVVAFLFYRQRRLAVT